MATHHSALTPISDFSPSSKVVTTWQTDSVVHKLKPRSFHRSTHLQVLWNTLDTNIFLFLLYFFFFFFLVTIKRHMTLQSHDMLHDVTS